MLLSREIIVGTQQSGETPVAPLITTRCWRQQGMTGSNSTFESRFWAKVRKGDDCWVWRGGRRFNGYGIIMRGNRFEAAHRVSWELAHGLIPSGLLVCHHCDNPPCVRPDHLFIGDHKANSADMVAKGRQRGKAPLKPKVLSPAERRLQTHCKRGHPLSGENLRIQVNQQGSTMRGCRSCMRQHRIVWKAKKRREIREAKRRERYRNIDIAAEA